MKPFNLEEAKAGKPVVTSTGLPVRIICFDRKQESSEGSWPICGLVSTSEDQELFMSYTAKGVAAGHNAVRNLFMVTEKREGWLNIWKSPAYATAAGGVIYETKEEAESVLETQKPYLVDTVKIEWEE